MTDPKVWYHRNDDCCRGCHLHLKDETPTWLANDHLTTPVGFEAWPFHARCANAPWPLFEVEGPPKGFYEMWVD